jgi:hypothetical protein
MSDPTPAQHARRHVLEALARYAEMLAVQPPLSPDAAPEAIAYRNAYQTHASSLAAVLWGKADQ